MFNLFKPRGGFSIITEDITQMKVDVVVNAANLDLIPGGGVCGAIYKAAGKEKLDQFIKTNQLKLTLTGNTVFTPSFEMKCKSIAHTAGPIYSFAEPEKSRKELKDSYFNTLHLAHLKGYRSIAFPLISSGIYGYPKDEAIAVAVLTIKEFVSQFPDMKIYLSIL